MGELLAHVCPPNLLISDILYIISKKMVDTKKGEVKKQFLLKSVIRTISHLHFK